ncbi:MAG TPA: nuclear transport factor 2 family protein [Pyrinomonadaceae bacterium]|nr:nuclear transport factor 2 family protein [Pyrinomonadaceae bacterium]
MSEQDNVQVVQQAYQNFKAGNIEALLGQMSDDVDWQLAEMENVSFSGRRKGRDGVAQFFSLLAEDQDVLQFEPHEFIAQGDKVAALGQYRWRVKSNGREYGGDWAHVFTIQDGKIKGFHEYMDTAAAAEAHKAG